LDEPSVTIALAEVRPGLGQDVRVEIDLPGDFGHVRTPNRLAIVRV
jgi:hypothetical protein